MKLPGINYNWQVTPFAKSDPNLPAALAEGAGAPLNALTEVTGAVAGAGERALLYDDEVQKRRQNALDEAKNLTAQRLAKEEKVRKITAVQEEFDADVNFSTFMKDASDKTLTPDQMTAFGMPPDLLSEDEQFNAVPEGYEVSWIENPDVPYGLAVPLAMQKQGEVAIDAYKQNMRADPKSAEKWAFDKRAILYKNVDALMDSATKKQLGRLIQGQKDRMDQAMEDQDWNLARSIQGKYAGSGEVKAEYKIKIKYAEEDATYIGMMADKTTPDDLLLQTAQMLESPKYFEKKTDRVGNLNDEQAWQRAKQLRAELANRQRARINTDSINVNLLNRELSQFRKTARNGEYSPQEWAPIESKLKALDREGDILAGYHDAQVGDVVRDMALGDPKAGTFGMNIEDVDIYIQDKLADINAMPVSLRPEARNILREAEAQFKSEIWPRLINNTMDHEKAYGTDIGNLGMGETEEDANVLQMRSAKAEADLTDGHGVYTGPYTSEDINKLQAYMGSWSPKKYGEYATWLYQTLDENALGAAYQLANSNNHAGSQQLLIGVQLLSKGVGQQALDKMFKGKEIETVKNYRDKSNPRWGITVGTAVNPASTFGKAVQDFAYFATLNDLTEKAGKERVALDWVALGGDELYDANITMALGEIPNGPGNYQYLVPDKSVSRAAAELYPVKLSTTEVKRQREAQGISSLSMSDEKIQQALYSGDLQLVGPIEGAGYLLKIKDGEFIYDMSRGPVNGLYRMPYDSKYVTKAQEANFKLGEILGEDFEGALEDALQNYMRKAGVEDTIENREKYKGFARRDVLQKAELLRIDASR